ncbi:MAG TPA: hypothetical protein VGI16_05735 [Candidatus Acidoferrum sp.]|jgi:hypothetical protein
MYRFATGLAIAIVLAPFAAPRALAQQTEAGLIAAWEQQQKADPKTIKFEKLGDKKYHFSTSRFPFDGEADIVDVNIGEVPPESDDSLVFPRGTVGVQLAGLTDDFRHLHEASYNEWESRNSFFWDNKSLTWLNGTQYMAAMRERGLARRPGFSTFFFGSGLSGIFLIIVLAMVFLSVLNSRRAKLLTKRSERSIEMAAQNLALQQENSQTLKAILEVLKRRP